MQQVLHNWQELEGKPCRVPDKEPVLVETKHEGADNKKAKPDKTSAVGKETPASKESREMPLESRKETPSKTEEEAKRRERTLREMRMAEKEIKRLELLRMIEMERQQLERLMVAKMHSTLAGAQLFPNPGPGGSVDNIETQPLHPAEIAHNVQQEARARACWNIWCLA